jgi:hypothetical protein
MNKLALTAIMVGGLIQASACIISTDDDPTGGVLDVTWPVAACSAPGVSATVYTLNQDTDEMFMDVYDCANGDTIIENRPIRLNLGNYSVWVEILSADGSRRHAISNATTVSFVLDGDTSLVTTDPVATEQGNFETEWTIGDGAGNALSCADVGATGGRILATSASTSIGDDFLFDCDAGYGKSGPLDPGEYDIQIDIIDSSTPPLAINDAEPAFQETIIGNYTIHLGIIDFFIVL